MERTGSSPENTYGEGDSTTHAHAHEAGDQHTREWELIDMDCAGCIACRCVHRCSASTCTDIETTEDSLVYRITVVIAKVWILG